MLDHVPPRVAVIGGGAIGCEFASTFADLGAKVTILEGLPKILPGCDADCANVVVRVLQEEGHRHPHRREGQRATRPTAPAAPRCTSARARTSRSTPSSCRSAAARSPTCSAWPAPRCRSTTAASSRSTSTAAPASPACTRWATSSTRRSWPTSASPRPSWSVKDMLGEHPLPDRSTTGCRGRSTATPRWPSPATREESAQAAGFDIVVAKHQFRGNSRALIIGETDGLVKVIAEKDADGTGRPDPRCPHGRPVGHRAARPAATSP